MNKRQQKNKKEEIKNYNIEVGMEFKSYRALCQHFNEPFKNGNAKKAQLKEWARYFDYRKDGNKFIITEVFDEPLDKYDARTFNSGGSIYTNDLQTLIMGLIHIKGKEDDYCLKFTRNQLMRELGLVNSTYAYGKQFKYGLSEHSGVSVDIVDDFYQITDGNLKSMLETALNQLTKKSLIDWSPIYTLKLKQYQIEDEEEGTYFELENDEIIREANDNEVSEILTIQSHLLDKYKCKNLAEVIYKGLSKQFFEEATEMLNQVLSYEIEYYYKEYKIIYTSKGIEYKLKEIPRDELESVMCRLNNNIKNNLLVNSMKREEESKQVIDDRLTDDLKEQLELKLEVIENLVSKKHTVRSNENYHKSNEKLIDITMERDMNKKNEENREKLNVKIECTHNNIIKKNKN